MKLDKWTAKAIVAINNLSKDNTDLYFDISSISSEVWKINRDRRVNYMYMNISKAVSVLCKYDLLDTKGNGYRINAKGLVILNDSLSFIRSMNIEL